MYNQSLIDFGLDFVANVIANLLLQIAIFIILIRIQSYYGLYEHFMRYIYSTFRKRHIILSVDYDTNLEISEIRHIIKNKFKESYGMTSINVRTENEHLFEFSVNNEFNVIIQRNVDEMLSFKTNKITSTKKEMKTDVKWFLDTLQEIEAEIAKINNSFIAKRFMISLFVPYVKTYMKFYEPRGLKIKKYIVELEEKTKNEVKQTRNIKYEIKLTGNIININSNYRHKIVELIDKFV